MSTIQMCRTCLAYGTRMYTIASTPLEAFYQNITNKILTTHDGRPSSLCYICYHLLNKCFKFAESAIRADEVLKQICNSENPINKQHIATIDERHLTFYKTRVTHVNIISGAMNNIIIPKESIDTAEKNQELTALNTSQKKQQITELGSPLLFEIKHEKIEIDDENLQLNSLWNEHALLQSDRGEKGSMSLESVSKCRETEVGDSNRKKRDSKHVRHSKCGESNSKRGERESKRIEKKSNRRERTSKRGEGDSKMRQRSECGESGSDCRERVNKCGDTDSECEKRDSKRGKNESVVGTGVAKKSGQRKKDATRPKNRKRSQTTKLPEETKINDAPRLKKVKQSTKTPEIIEAQMTSKENANNTSTNNVLKEFNENKYDFEYTVNKTEVDENTYSNEMKKVNYKKDKKNICL